MTKLLKPTLYDLFSFHAQARGTLVHDKQKATLFIRLMKVLLLMILKQLLKPT